MSSPLALGVDGGGSKTDVAVVRADGEALALVRGPASHTHHHGVDPALDVIDELIDEALGEAAVARTSPVAGAVALTVAGADFPAEEEALAEAVRRRGWGTRSVVLNDTFAILRAGTDEGWGVAVTCGSGINCVGVARDGRHIRFPSLGPITGDWGGGGDVGLAGVSAAARSADGRGPKTTLERAVPAYFGLETPLELAEAFHLGRIGRRRVIELAPVVFAEAADDPVAAEIVARLAEEVVALARAALTRLGVAHEPAPVLLGGGIFQRGDAQLLAAVEAGLREVGPSLAVRVTTSPPVVGAALLALDALEASPAAQARLREELGAAFERIGGGTAAVAAGGTDG